MARIYQGLISLNPSNPKPFTGIKVSVIITTNKAPDDLKDIIGDLSIQNYSHNSYEIIIADDSAGKWDGHVWDDVPGSHLYKIVPNAGVGKKKAIDTAIRQATGELIITTDDDCRIGNNWILVIASHYHRYKPGMIICPVEINGGNSFFNQIQQLEFFSLQGVTAGSSEIGDPIMCNGAGLAFRRDLYPGADYLAGSKVLSGDDIFLLHYMKKKRIPVKWLEAENAIVRTSAATGLLSFIRQRSRWASKSLSYNDTSTIITGLAVIVASVTTGTFLILSLINPAYIRTAILLILVKSIPDSLIIMNRLEFHGKSELFWYFPLAQLLHPFYVTISLFAGLSRRKKW